MGALLIVEVDAILDRFGPKDGNPAPQSLGQTGGKLRCNLVSLFGEVLRSAWAGTTQ